jgi:hypothetical protein
MGEVLIGDLSHLACADDDQVTRCHAAERYSPT